MDGPTPGGVSVKNRFGFLKEGCSDKDRRRSKESLFSLLIKYGDA